MALAENILRLGELPSQPSMEAEDEINEFWGISPQQGPIKNGEIPQCSSIS